MEVQHNIQLNIVVHMLHILELINSHLFYFPYFDQSKMVD